VFLPVFFARLFGSIFWQCFCKTFLLKKCDGFCGRCRLANGAQIWRILAHKFGLNFDGENERQFHQIMCNFLLGKQSLVNSTPTFNFTNILQVAFALILF
jgi:hypothetical protein